RDVAPAPARSFWIRTLPFFEPKPPATQSSSASRSTRAWCVAKCHVSRERFWIDTYSNLEPCSRKNSCAVFVYERTAGEADETSSARVKRAPSSAMTRRRQKSELSSLEFVTRT